MGEDLTLFEWLTRIVVPAGRHLTREMAMVGSMLKGAELLLSGVTCTSDMFCHTNMGSLASLGAVDGLEAMGLRRAPATSRRRHAPVLHGSQGSLVSGLGQRAGRYHEKVAAARTCPSPGVDHSSTTRMRELGRYQTRCR